MNLSPVAAEYIRTHRTDCSDAEIRVALKAQGFSDMVLDVAFAEAGPRAESTPLAGAMRKLALARLLYAISALCLVAAAVMFVRNLLR